MRGWWLSGCHSSVAEHWLHKPSVLGGGGPYSIYNEVWFQVNASLFTFHLLEKCLPRNVNMHVSNYNEVFWIVRLVELCLSFLGRHTIILFLNRKCMEWLTILTYLISLLVVFNDTVWNTCVSWWYGTQGLGKGKTGIFVGCLREALIWQRKINLNFTMHIMIYHTITLHIF